MKQYTRKLHLALTPYPPVMRTLTPAQPGVTVHFSGRTTPEAQSDTPPWPETPKIDGATWSFLKFNRATWPFKGQLYVLQNYINIGHCYFLNSTRVRGNIKRQRHAILAFLKIDPPPPIKGPTTTLARCGRYDEVSIYSPLPAKQPKSKLKKESLDGQQQLYALNCRVIANNCATRWYTRQD